MPPQGASPQVGESWYPSERGKVEALIEMHSALNVSYAVPPSVHPLEENSTRYFLRYGMPARNVANLGWFHGIEDTIDPATRALLVGIRGNFGLTWNGMFSLVELLRAGRLPEFARELGATARCSGKGMIQILSSEVIVRMMPDSAYRTYLRARGRDPDDVSRSTLLNPEFCADSKLAAEWNEQGYDPYFAARGTSGAEFRARHLFDHNQMARDVIFLNADADGRDIRDPHADRRLLEFCLSVPEPMFRKNGVPRSFARRVLADRLPQEILKERRRGAQSPAWFHSLNARREDIAREINSFETSKLASRLLDLPRLKRLMDQWPKNEIAAEARKKEYKFALARGVHVGKFIRWVEGGNA